MAKKHKKINKQAAKLKEMRRNAPTHVALAMIQGLRDFYKRADIDNIYDYLEKYREENKHKWYDRCYIPYSMASSYIVEILRGDDEENSASLYIDDIFNSVVNTQPQLSKTEIKEVVNEITQKLFQEAVIFAPIAAAWRQHKQIFKFDIDFFESLSYSVEEIFKAGNEDVLTRDELQSLPFPTFYVDLPICLEDGEEYCGFFFTYNSLGDKTDTLDFYFVGKLAEVCASQIEKYPNKSIILNSFPSEVKYDLHDENPDATLWENYFKDCIKIDPETQSQEEMDDIERRNKNGFILLFTALQAVTYLASRHADVTPNKVSKRTFKHATEIRDIPSEALIWDVGTRHGSIMRKITEEEQNRETEICYCEIDRVYRPASRKKPHSRAGHYQNYWYGKKDGSEVRRREPQWVNPTYVNYNGKEKEELDRLPAVYHEVISFEDSADIK